MLAHLVAEGKLPRPDAAIFSDTENEPPMVYAQLDRIEEMLAKVDVPMYRVGRGNLCDDVLDPHVIATIPAFTKEVTADGIKYGRAPRRCTGKYKIEPVQRQIRILLGAAIRPRPCTYCDTTGVRVAPWSTDGATGPCSVCQDTGERRLVGASPRGKTVEHWVGFSSDEVSRVNEDTFPAYARPRFPLMDLKMTRKDCERFLRARGFPVVKSACIVCPLHGNRAWREMRDERPEEWAQAIEFDRAFRKAPGMRAEKFLHRTCVPLDVAPIDKVTPGEWTDRQVEIWDALEEGDPDGCGPWSCRDHGDAEPIPIDLLFPPLTPGLPS